MPYLVPILIASDCRVFGSEMHRVELSCGCGTCGASRGNLLKLSFLMFDEENPKLWIRRSHDYFDMYVVKQPLWVKVASMHFVGSAARWLSSLDDHFLVCRGHHFVTRTVW